MQVAEPRTRRWTRAEYYRMGEMGLFDGQRVELIEGEIVTMTPQGTGHAVGIQLAHEALRKAFGQAFRIRPQLPLALDLRSEPEPDIAVVRGAPRDFLDSHPTPPATVLVVEVAASTLDYDRHTKGSLYARAGIPEFWLVNLVERQIEVCRDPRPAPGAPFGWEYADVQILLPGASVLPIEAAAPVLVEDLLP